jgi:glutamate-5-semialdehyde dehydrogenase
MDTTENFGAAAKAASTQLPTLSAEQRIAALKAAIAGLQANAAEIFAANETDLANAKAAGLDAPLLKRLKFDQAKLDDCIGGIKMLCQLPDLVGKTLKTTELAPELILSQVSCPLGVVGIIFESRPDALVQISTLCIKSANACVLKGGIEALNTNTALHKVLVEATKGILPDGWLQLIATRDDVKKLLTMDKYVDLIIPRGSNSFVQYVMNNTQIPVMGHADGICHIYVDKAADSDLATKVSVDSKCQYPAVCNAVETILVHESIAAEYLPKLKAGLDEKHATLRGCEKCQSIIDCDPATTEDWGTEYLDYIVSVKIVSDMEEAIAHINEYGSGHTDCIITADTATAELFMNRVDSADVFWNCSTRFADGFRFGLGAEVGISTSKLHARGPVGVEGLLTYKWKLRGNGHTVAPFANGETSFTHKPL